MYFTPILITDLKKGPYFIVENHWCNEVKMYIAELSPPHPPRYTTLTNVYEYMNPIKKIPNQIQLKTTSLCFFKMVPTILPKLKQRMLDQILQKITGDTTFTYPIFEPNELHYFLED